MFYRTVLIHAIALVCWLCYQATAQTISSDVNDLKFFYFQSRSQKIEIAFNNRNSLEQSNIQSGRPTVVIVDGFLSNSTSPMSLTVSESYVNRGGHNVILLDWGNLSGSRVLASGNPLTTVTLPVLYLAVLGNVGPVGQRLAEFLNFLRIEKQIDFSDVTIVGHSLGAHISGVAGLTVRNNYSASVARIVGLDPAGPLYNLQLDNRKKINKDDAAFVDLYHTNRGTLGDTADDTGTVDIYINGGSSQPGCASADLIGFPGYCSHSYSHKLFNTAFNINIIACPCSGLACTCATCSNACSDDGINIGPDISLSARGRYFVAYGPLP